MEACWAHNPEVRRSKLRSASYFFFSVHMMCLIQRGRDMAPRSVQVPLAQRIARWTSNPKVLGSIPRWDGSFWGPSNLCVYVQSGRTRRHVRMAEWSKAPDSRFMPCFQVGSEWEFWSSDEGRGSNPLSDRTFLLPFPPWYRLGLTRETVQARLGI